MKKLRKVKGGKAEKLWETVEENETRDKTKGPNAKCEMQMQTQFAARTCEMLPQKGGVAGGS